MKVRATRLGYYDLKRRYPPGVKSKEGDVFVLTPKNVVERDEFNKPVLDSKGKPKMKVLTAEDQFTPSWMERVDKPSRGKNSINEAPPETEDFGTPPADDDGQPTGDADVI